MPAEKTAELVFIIFRPLIARFAVNRELRRIQRFIAQVLEQAAVKLRCAGFCCRDDLRTSRGAVFRLVTGRDYLELTHHIGGHAEVGECHHSALGHGAFLHAHAIHDGLIARLKAAIDARVESVVSASGGDAGHKNGELRRVPGPASHNERKLIQCCWRDPFLPDRVIEVERRSIGYHFQCLYIDTDFQLHIDSNQLI